VGEAGHLPPLERPEVVSGAMIPFLARLFEHQKSMNVTKVAQPFSFLNTPPQQHNEGLGLSFA